MFPSRHETDDCSVNMHRRRDGVECGGSFNQVLIGLSSVIGPNFHFGISLSVGARIRDRSADRQPQRSVELALDNLLDGLPD